MKHQLTDLLMIASDQINAFGAKAINAVGAVSIGAGTAIVAVGNDALKAAAPDTWLSPDYVMAASIFGSVCFGLKHLYDFINSIIDRYKASKSSKSLTSKN